MSAQALRLREVARLAGKDRMELMRMTAPLRKLFAGAIVKDSTLNDREIRVVASDPTPDRVGDVMLPSGCQLEAYRSNPIVLANHEPDKPIGTAEPSIKNNRVEALITFAPPGLSKTADEFCGLAKAGILKAVSVGFEPIDSEPIKGGGVRYKAWSLLELSIVSVPANPNALIIQRSRYGAAGPRISGSRFVDLLRVCCQEAREAEFDFAEAARQPTPSDAERKAADAIWRDLDRTIARSRKRLEWYESTTPEQRMEHHRAKRHQEIRDAALEMLTPDQQRDFRRRQVAAYERPEIIEPPRWRGDNATYCAEVREYDRKLVRLGLRT